MHKLPSSNVYVGQPIELVSLSTNPDNGGQVTADLDGTPIAANSQFSLPGSPGAQSVLRVKLNGPIGASTDVGIAVVDGATDMDFLICQTHNPAPIHEYKFVVATATAVNRLGMARGAGGARLPGVPKAPAKKPRARKPRAKKPRRKGGSR